MQRGSDKQCFAIGSVLGLLIAVGLNYLSYLRASCPATIDECGFRFGFPVPFFVRGGFVGYQYIDWINLSVDITFVVGLSVIVGLLTRWLASKKAVSLPVGT